MSLVVVVAAFLIVPNQGMAPVLGTTMTMNDARLRLPGRQNQREQEDSLQDVRCGGSSSNTVLGSRGCVGVMCWAHRIRRAFC